MRAKATSRLLRARTEGDTVPAVRVHPTPLSEGGALRHPLRRAPFGRPRLLEAVKRSRRCGRRGSKAPAPPQPTRRLPPTALTPRPGRPRAHDKSDHGDRRGRRPATGVASHGDKPNRPGRAAQTRPLPIRGPGASGDPARGDLSLRQLGRARRPGQDHGFLAQVDHPPPEVVGSLGLGARLHARTVQPV